MAISILLMGCGSYDNLSKKGEIQYKSAGKSKTLDVPPDLTSLPAEERFTVPQGPNRATATFSGFVKGKENAPTQVDGKNVAPTFNAARIERAGTQRWLVVNQPVEKVWLEVKAFWLDNGFLLNIDQPELGIMETDWAENRAKIPQDIIRRTIGKVFDGLWSTSERDKYRTRIERNGQGAEIFITHRGMQEVVNSKQDSSIWQPRDSDPELEVEFLRRLLLRFGDDEQTAKAKVIANPTDAPSRADFVPSAQNQNAYLLVKEPFERAWRRAGLALDRVGFTVEDRNRADGIYFVRYVDPDESGELEKRRGFFEKIFVAKDNKQQQQQFQIKLTTEAGEVTRLDVRPVKVNPDNQAVAERILKLLQDQLK
ncbi:outer membrane protein assembly factor BamC [Parvibium lacunae]|uniref:Outer membrane protein assembly factor BamC n=1 Tax=Parvibium lacunae TaxID=1888893 RepID=A0A368L8P8_9BURK|nr:outer membrane protein assembly factor BamC [Parvibium lacunae]RCS59932.1 outer membrane protein assembly factor BamC [Parvibium lacunae]